MRIKLLYLPRVEIDYNTGKPLDGTGWYKTYIPPLGIAILTSCLKFHNFKIEQDDLLIKAYKRNISLIPFLNEEKIKQFVRTGEEETLEEIGEKLIKMTKLRGVDIVGFSLYESENPSTGSIPLVLGKIIKEKYDSLILIGGRISEKLKENLLKSGYIDYSIAHRPFSGPAELHLLKFCEAMEKGRLKEEEVPGLEYLRNGKLISNPSHFEKKEINKIWAPNFDGLPLHLYKFSFSEKGKKMNFLVFPYYFIKGCPFKCAFCTNSLSPYYVKKSVEEIIEDLQNIKKKYGGKYFCFFNSEVNPTYKFAKELMKGLEKLNIKWEDSVSPNNLDYSLLRKMKDAGAVRLIIGIESCSRKILKYVEKNIDLYRTQKIIRYAKRIGLRIEVNLISGFPFERVADVISTVNFLKRNKSYIDVAYVNKFFLDGKMRAFPRNYRIKIRNTRKIKGVKEEWRSGFDEIGGLKWEKRKVLTEKLFNFLITSIHQMGISTSSDLHLPFFLDYLQNS
ncbi:MAG: radical SAM protein [Candidatus Aenigmatarchaeota archaeon]